MLFCLSTIDEFNDNRDVFEDALSRWNDEDAVNDGNIVPFWGNDAFALVISVGVDNDNGGSDNTVPDTDARAWVAEDDNGNGAGDAAVDDTNSVVVGFGNADAGADVDADAGTDADADGDANPDAGDAVAANNADADDITDSAASDGDSGAGDDLNNAEADGCVPNDVDVVARDSFNVVDDASDITANDAEADDSGPNDAENDEGDGSNEVCTGAGDTPNDDDDVADTAPDADEVGSDELHNTRLISGEVIAAGNTEVALIPSDLTATFVLGTVLRLFVDVIKFVMVLFGDIVRFFKIYSIPLHSILWTTNTFPTGQTKFATVSSGNTVSLTATN